MIVLDSGYKKNRVFAPKSNDLGASKTRFHPNLLLHFILLYSAIYSEKAPLAYLILLGSHYPKLA